MREMTGSCSAVRGDPEGGVAARFFAFVARKRLILGTNPPLHPLPHL